MFAWKAAALLFALTTLLAIVLASAWRSDAAIARDAVQLVRETRSRCDRLLQMSGSPHDTALVLFAAPDCAHVATLPPLDTFPPAR